MIRFVIIRDDLYRGGREAFIPQTTGRDCAQQKKWKQYDAIVEIFKQLNKKRKHADNTVLMVQINQIISEYVQIKVQQEFALCKKLSAP